MEEATRIHPLARSSFVGVHNGVARAENNEESRGTGKSAKRLKRVPLQEREPIMFEEEDAVLTPEEKMEIERTLPFCCAQCECSDAHKRALATEGASCKCTVLSPSISNFSPHTLTIVIDFIRPDSTDTYLFHRRCCHNVKGNDEEWAPPYLCCEQKSNELFEKGYVPMDSGMSEMLCEEDKREVDREHICEAYELSRKNINRKDFQEVNPAHIPRTSEDYIAAVVKPFQRLKKIKQEESTRQGITVIDVFSGIGTAVLCLMRNSISIRKVIHVDHDKVATHVSRFNLDLEYNDKAKFGCKDIQHIYDYCSFDALRENILGICEQHGPIDLMYVLSLVCSPLCFTINERKTLTRSL